MRRRRCAALILAALAIPAIPAQAIRERTLDGREKALLIRAIASSYPEAEYAAQVGMAAAALNRMDRCGIGLADAAEALAAEGAFPAWDQLAGEIGEKEIRIAENAVEAALAGADPTGGAVTFRRFEGDAGWETDLRFDDRREDTERAQIREAAEDYAVLIGGIGFR